MKKIMLFVGLLLAIIALASPPTMAESYDIYGYNALIKGSITGQGNGSLSGYLTATSDKTAAYTLVDSDAGKTFTNAGASGSVTFNLDDKDAGFKVCFANANASSLTLLVNPADTDQIEGLTNAIGDAAQSTTLGDCACAEAVSVTRWVWHAGYGTFTDAN